MQERSPPIGTITSRITIIAACGTLRAAVVIRIGQRTPICARMRLIQWQGHDRPRPDVKYDEYLVAGYPIATCAIKGASRHLVKDRMERTGMRWTVEDSQAMVHRQARYQSSYCHDSTNHKTPTFNQLPRAAFRNRRNSGCMLAMARRRQKQPSSSQTIFEEFFADSSPDQ